MDLPNPNCLKNSLFKQKATAIRKHLASSLLTDLTNPLSLRNEAGLYNVPEHPCRRHEREATIVHPKKISAK